MTDAESDPQTIGPNAIWCRFTFERRYRIVVIDRETGLIEFRHSHVPRRFLARAQSSFRCSIADVKAVHFTPPFRNGRGGLTVVTSTGKAYIPAIGSNFAELREWFAHAVPINQPDFATDNPAIWFVYVLGALVGLFTGVFLTRNAGDTALVIATVLGAIGGVVGSHLLVYLGARLLRTDFAQPVGYAMIGLTIGIGISEAIQMYVAWNPALTTAIVVAGVVLGVLAGLRKRTLKKEMTEQSDAPKSPVNGDLET